MKRTATIITLLAIVGSVALGIVIGRLSGGSDGETLPASDLGQEQIRPTGTATIAASAEASPTTDSPLLASPAMVGTPEGVATPHTAATPVRPTPTMRTTVAANAEPAASGTSSLGELQHAPTATPTFAPNPSPPATATPSPSPPTVEEESSIIIRGG